MEKKILTLQEVKELYGSNCNETATAFTVSMFGKYQPNLTFVLGKEFQCAENAKEPFDPLRYFSAKGITDNMNIDFDGSAEVLFGDFWLSKAGKPHFRVKEPKDAKDMLIRVSWGGAFNFSRGRRESDLSDTVGIKYFRRAESNGGGAGNDYYVVPVGYRRIVWDEEIDGPKPVDFDPMADSAAVAAARVTGQKRYDSIRESYLNYNG
ncbi:hypothetical protein IJJ39_01920 [Candidatus Saccharibacteria bacterium]|nr:hypothetical protein [Candidatus Saccharibacteria bacterium]